VHLPPPISGTVTLTCQSSFPPGVKKRQWKAHPARPCGLNERQLGECCRMCLPISQPEYGKAPAVLPLSHVGRSEHKRHSPVPDSSPCCRSQWKTPGHGCSSRYAGGACPALATIGLLIMPCRCCHSTLHPHRAAG
jgi:hypothetical protein